MLSLHLVADLAKRPPANSELHVEAASDASKVDAAAKKHMPSSLPMRYTKEFNQFRQAQEDKAAERQRKDEEIRLKNRKRREHAKGRALVGKRLQDVSTKGQPRMGNILDTVTAKLASEGLCLPSARARPGKGGGKGGGKGNQWKRHRR